MKYEKCLSCTQLGDTCDGPNLLAMETIDLGLWCNELRKDTPGATYEKIAAETDLSKSAVRDFLTGKHDDCSMRTARTIARYITKGKWDDNPCGNIDNSERATYEEKIRQLESEIRWRDDKIQHLANNHESMQTLVANTNARYTKDKEFLQEQIKSKSRANIVLIVALAICLLVIISALIVDRINPEIGFFWLRSWLGGTDGTVRTIAKGIT